MEKVPPRGVFSGCARNAAHTLYINSSPICVYKRMIWLRCRAVYLHVVLQCFRSSSVHLHSRNLLDFLSTRHRCYFMKWRGWAGGEKIAVVDTERRAAPRKHSLTDLQNCCRRLESVAQRKRCRVVSLSLFITILYIIFMFR